MNTNYEKTILITGTSKGIGLALAKRFVALDYQVLGISRSRASFTHPRFVQLCADLADNDAIESLRETIVSYDLTGVIHNAGLHGPIGPFEKNPIGFWRDTFQVNLFSAGLLSQICIPGLRKRRGFIIFLSGGGSAFARPNFTAYAVSKTAIVRFSETLAQELAPDVFVYCVAPGPNKTQLLDEAIQGGENVPPQDIVDFDYPFRLCRFLAENQDIRYSGKFIHVKDDYWSWDMDQQGPDAYTLRRIKG